MNGFAQNHTKALELYYRAAELGYADAYVCIGYAYIDGRGAEIDKKKARHYWELAAMGGSVTARFNLGVYELRAQNMNRALKHYMIATRDGCAKSLKEIQKLYLDGHVTKVDYTAALQDYQVYLGEIKTDQRDEAAATNDEYRYFTNLLLISFLTSLTYTFVQLVPLPYTRCFKFKSTI